MIYINTKESKIVRGQVIDAIKRGHDVRITGLCTFNIREYNARVGRNPKTGEKITIPKRKRIKIRVSKLTGDVVK